MSEFIWDAELIGKFLEAQFPRFAKAFIGRHTPQADSRDDDEIKKASHDYAFGKSVYSWYEKQKPDSRDWEIVAYEFIPLGIFITNESAHWPKDNRFPFKIHSVKRLTDNEVFTVGDEVVDSIMFHKPASIKRFEIEVGKMWVSFGETMRYMLHEIKKSTQPKEETKPLSDRVEVDIFKSSCDAHNGMLVYTYASSKKISDDKFPLIKQAIESVLNDDRPTTLIEEANLLKTTATGKHIYKFPSEKIYGVDDQPK